MNQTLALFTVVSSCLSLYSKAYIIMYGTNIDFAHLKYMYIDATLKIDRGNSKSDDEKAIFGARWYFCVV